MQLVVPDIDRIDLARAARQQHLGEATGRGPDIEARAPRRIEAEMIERSGELDAAARHERIRRFRAQDRIRRDFRRSLGDRHVVHADEPGLDGRLRLGAALEQAALDQQPVDPHQRRRSR